jgi:hypothetical protein
VKELTEKSIASQIDHMIISDAAFDEAAAKARERERQIQNFIDATAAAKMSIAGEYKTEKGSDTEKITSTVQLDASADTTLSLAGASLSKKAEGRFEAKLERRFTGGKLTGATMSRRYIMAKSDANYAKEILEGFGIKNDAILRDLQGELAGLEGVVLVFDAELTKDGLDRYQKSHEENSERKKMFLLNDRRNYVATGVRLEVPVNKESQIASLGMNLTLKSLGVGGGVRMGYKAGADAAIRQTYRYSAHSS